MSTPPVVWVAHLEHGDHSGLIQSWGPFVSKEEAEEAAETLKGWPAISYGNWIVAPLARVWPV